MLLKPLAGSGPITSKHPFVRPNIIVRNVWRVAQKSSWINVFGLRQTQVDIFCAPHFLHTSNGFSMILTHVKCHLRCRGEKSLFLHRFYKQNEIVSILLFGVLGGLEGALRQTCFATCFKTPARIKILRRNIAFGALAPVGSLCHFLR